MVSMMSRQPAAGHRGICALAVSYHVPMTSDPQVDEVLAAALGHVRASGRVVVVGPGGIGKSTLVTRLVERTRARRGDRCCRRSRQRWRRECVSAVLDSLGEATLAGDSVEALLESSAGRASRCDRRRWCRLDRRRRPCRGARRYRRTGTAPGSSLRAVFIPFMSYRPWFISVRCRSAMARSRRMRRGCSGRGTQRPAGRSTNSMQPRSVAAGAGNDGWCSAGDPRRRRDLGRRRDSTPARRSSSRVRDRTPSRPPSTGASRCSRRVSVRCSMRSL